MPKPPHGNTSVYAETRTFYYQKEISKNVTNHLLTRKEDLSFGQAKQINHFWWGITDSTITNPCMDGWKSTEKTQLADERHQKYISQK
jgi:hypothetical protein